MATRALSEILPYVLPEVSGCSNLMGIDYIRQAANDFLRRTLAYKVPATITTSPALNGYAIPGLPASTNPFKVYVAKNPDGSPIVPRIKVDLDGELPAGWETQTDSVLLALWLEGRRLVRFFPIPSATLAIPMTVALELQPTATELDAELVDEHYDTIAAGAKARLLRMKTMPWFDGPAAVDCQAIFDRGVAGRSTESAADQSRAPMRTKSYYSIG